MVNEKENFNLQTKGFSPKCKYVITNVPSRKSLKKDFLLKVGKIGIQTHSKLMALILK